MGNLVLMIDENGPPKYIGLVNSSAERLRYIRNV